jgi:hypothetical protein
MLMHDSPIATALGETESRADQIFKPLPSGSGSPATEKAECKRNIVAGDDTKVLQLEDISTDCFRLPFSPTGSICGGRIIFHRLEHIIDHDIGCMMIQNRIDVALSSVRCPLFEKFQNFLMVAHFDAPLHIKVRKYKGYPHQRSIPR